MLAVIFNLCPSRSLILISNLTELLRGKEEGGGGVESVFPSYKSLKFVASRN